MSAGVQDSALVPNARVRVVGGHYVGEFGRLVRKDGTLRGQPGWLVKLDDRMLGAFVETRHLRVDS